MCIVPKMSIVFLFFKHCLLPYHDIFSSSTNFGSLQQFPSYCYSLQKDFMSLELFEGKVKMNFDLGSGVGTAISTNRHNDGRWKALTMSRNKKHGKTQDPGFIICAALQLNKERKCL